MRLHLPLPLLAALTAFTSLSTAARLTLTIAPNALLSSAAALPPSTHATLQSSGPPLRALLTKANTFVFDNVPAGSYLGVVHCRDIAFEALRIDVAAAAAAAAAAAGGAGLQKVDAWQTFWGNEWENRGEKRGEGAGGVVVEVRPVGVKEFYQSRGGFDPLSFLKNPMILMALFSMVIIFGMPYLMENMDEETKAEFEEMRGKGVLSGGPTPASQLQNFDLASWMAGKTDSGTPPAAIEPAQGKGKKRG
ncbi:uncharacterized protein BDZ99DRAFT_462036 [Mytilinidion resinicola]|uniref:ER membrane protein complex subunit 7 beta-sandwich domain-containing protein n=1 Tax=Mytilinidion resinicola TaxID=574789 RepID=A0A6A6YPI4_9PEZI|nr:uncharacterized protein BDZ99DRAFT_462036 [Mytilinidion resinicola]KAF2810690.1 hypothetical protein BDZ99DRAFT_462036 [Mytilinidion resinicola]